MQSIRQSQSVIIIIRTIITVDIMIDNHCLSVHCTSLKDG